MECQNMETRMDFLECLETDVSVLIMSRLDDSTDLVRASSVSHTWRDFMIANGLAKNVCLKRFPQLSKAVVVANSSEEPINSVKMGYDMEAKNLDKEHEVYTALFHALTKSKVRPKGCKINGISASSTDNYPQESIANTLNPRDRFAGGALYWSSKGELNPDVPETLIYKLGSNMCVVTEVNIHPFEAFFQMRRPIYAAKSVRIRIGHPKDPKEIEKELQLHVSLLEPADHKFVWTYTSSEFPMFQENYLQQFKLPEPVLCIDGYVGIELLGRVRRQDLDGLYYICVNHVLVLGRPLYPAFNMEIMEPYEKLLLSYERENLSSVLHDPPNYYDDDHDDYGNIRLEDLEGDALRGRIGFVANPMRGIQQRPLLY